MPVADRVLRAILLGKSQAATDRRRAGRLAGRGAGVAALNEKQRRDNLALRLPMRNVSMLAFLIVSECERMPGARPPASTNMEA